MTLAQPAAPHPAGPAPVVDEPSRFAAYATGCDERGGAGAFVARVVGRLLTPELSRMAQRGVSRPRSRS